MVVRPSYICTEIDANVLGRAVRLNVLLPYKIWQFAYFWFEEVEAGVEADEKVRFHCCH